MRRFYLLFYSACVAAAVSAEPLPEGFAILGLYPTGNEIVESGTVAFEYASAPFEFAGEPAFEHHPIVEEITNWRVMDWTISDQAGNAPGKIQCSILYTGALELTGQQQRDCRPVVWLTSARGIEIPREAPLAPWYSRWFGGGSPTRFDVGGDEPLNVVMLMVDTLRADHAPMYGHPFVIAPHMELIAKMGILFETSYGASSSTRPSVGSIFTGQYPKTHGATRHSKTSAGLHENTPRLAEQFRERGYETAGVSSNSQVTSAFGFDAGFQNYDCPVWETRVSSGGIEYLRNLSEPFFLYLHYMAPHAPYTPPKNDAAIYQGKTDFEEEDLYCAEITLDDRRIGEVLAELVKQGLLDRTLIWLVSDHGEEFWEHGWNGHGANLFEESTRTVSAAMMPKILSMGQRVSFPAMHVDIFPTIADMLGWETPVGLQGRSLLQEMAEAPANKPVFLHHGGGAEPGVHESDKDAVVSGGYKLVWWNQKDEWELYHLASDILEQKNIAEAHPDAKASLEALLKHHVAKCFEAAAEQSGGLDAFSIKALSEEDIENMKTYGYF